MNKNIKTYYKLSHELAKKQLIERFCFEIEANKKIFNKNEISLDILINDCHSEEVFSEKEYIEVYRMCIKKMEKTEVIEKTKEKKYRLKEMI